MCCDGSADAGHELEHRRAGFWGVHQIPADAGFMEPLGAEEQDVRLYALRYMVAEGCDEILPACVADDDEFLLYR